MPSLHRLLILGAVAVTGGCASRGAIQSAGDAAPEAAVTTGRGVIDAMHARWAGRYLTTLSFLQNNTLYQASGGEQKSQWLEHLALPGKLRIDYVPLSGRSGVLYNGGRVYAFDNGRQVQNQPGTNPLLLLGFDVYGQPTAATAQTLDTLGFNLGVMHEGQWRGRRAYVVGAASGDTVTNQFWVDAERMLLVRMLQRNAAGTVISEYRFDRYTDFEGVPVAIEVMMLRNGRPYFKEEYTNVRVNMPIANEVFDPARWVEAQPKMSAPPAPSPERP